MTTKNQKRLAAQAARREEARARENAAFKQSESQRQAENTPEQQQALDRIDQANTMIKQLRDWGLYYSINSDRTADREPCLCGCGQFPAGKKSVFCPGHDARAKAALAGPREPKHCACGCGTETKGTWAPGHDAKFHAAQRKAAKEAAASQQVA